LAADPASDTRARILDAAIAEFGLKGFAGARVDKIAELARANRQLIYYYFESKAGLYEATLTWLMTRTAQLDKTNPRQDFREFIEILSSPDPPNADWRRFWLWEALEQGDESILHEKQRHEVFARAVQRISQAQGQGLLDLEFDPEMLYLALLSISIIPHLVPQLTKLITGDRHQDPRYQERQAKFIDQLLQHLKPADPPSLPPAGDSST
jgi:TetR/AcrR family transcriptional regulator